MGLLFWKGKTCTHKLDFIDQLKCVHFIFAAIDFNFTQPEKNIHLYNAVFTLKKIVVGCK